MFMCIQKNLPYKLSVGDISVLLVLLKNIFCRIILTTAMFLSIVVVSDIKDCFM